MEEIVFAPVFAASNGSLNVDEQLCQKNNAKTMTLGLSPHTVRRFVSKYAYIPIMSALSPTAGTSVRPELICSSCDNVQTNSDVRSQRAVGFTNSHESMNQWDDEHRISA